MSLNINIKLIEDISEDIRKVSLVYDSVTCLLCTSRSNKEVVGILDILSIQNNDFYLLLQNYKNNITNVGSLLHKLVYNKDLEKHEKDCLNLIRNIVKIETDKSIIKDINNIIKDYKKKILNKEDSFLSSIYYSSEINLKAYSITGFKRLSGSAFRGGLFLSVTPYIKQTKYYSSNKIKDPTMFYKILNHELIHVINKNNDIYIKLFKYLQDNANYNVHFFSECFTSVIENLLNYNLKVYSKKWNQYYYKDVSKYKLQRNLEQQIRNKYEEWEVNKEKIFIEYLYDNKELFIKSNL
jgi:hypothetical protein